MIPYRKWKNQKRNFEFLQITVQFNHTVTSKTSYIQESGYFEFMAKTITERRKAPFLYAHI